MGFWARAARDWRFLRGLLRSLGRLRGVAPDSHWLACDDLEAAVDKYRTRTAIVFEGKSLTYGDLDAMANRYANWARARGVKRGETVALFMPNRLDYIAVWFGLSKVGIAVALINSNLTGPALSHSLNISGAVHLIVDAETAPAFEAVRANLTRSMMEWVVGGTGKGQRAGDRDLDRALKGVSALRPSRESARGGITAREVMLYIYTSGTTGLPKAARIPHTRAQLYMRGFAAATEATPNDRLYLCLPLYHATGGLCAVGAALLNGGALLLKRKFSATSFWPEVVEEKATLFVYIGELCRYLVNQPERPEERMHSLRLAFGNGLSLDVWLKMLNRFRIPRILEFYGATEGNVSMLNFDGKPGAVGRIPRYLRKRFNVRLVRFDVEAGEAERGMDGLCVGCRPGETGLALGEIKTEPRYEFAGYADKQASERKILRDVFAKGDTWFSTGDLLRQDSEGYFYFIDRVGDTFRWKGENVSTSEVGARLSEVPGVLEANVYGVATPGAEGRAGMAAIVVGQGFDLKALQSHLDATLPSYARPVFLRLQSEIATTGTFKYRKVDLAADGFNPGALADPLYVRDPADGYRPLDAALYREIEAGELRL